MMMMDLRKVRIWPPGRFDTKAWTALTPWKLVGGWWWQMGPFKTLWPAGWPAPARWSMSSRLRHQPISLDLDDDSDDINIAQCVFNDLSLLSIGPGLLRKVDRQDWVRWNIGEYWGRTRHGCYKSDSWRSPKVVNNGPEISSSGPIQWQTILYNRSKVWAECWAFLGGSSPGHTGAWFDWQLVRCPAPQTTLWQKSCVACWSNCTDVKQH